MAKTNFTIDSDAQYVNKTFLDPINHFAQCGNILKNILVVRFKGNVKAFRKYVKHNLNVSCQSAFRYISLFENYEAVKHCSKLCSAYKILGLSGNFEVHDED